MGAWVGAMFGLARGNNRHSPDGTRAHEFARLKDSRERLHVDRRRLQRWLPACRFRTGPQRSFWTVSWLLTDLTPSVARAMASLNAAPLTPRLGEIRCPTQVIVGEKDFLGAGG